MTHSLNLKFSFAFNGTRIISYVKSIMDASKDIQSPKFYYFANKNKNTRLSDQICTPLNLLKDIDRYVDLPNLCTYAHVHACTHIIFFLYLNTYNLGIIFK